jgi:redox-sensitive bicupin YhaK (pirin superfamily)
MSFFPGNDPQAGDAFASDQIELMVIPNAKDIGGFQVRRALPTAKRRLVGPFIFFDRMGPAILRAGQALDVRPHPHIGLSTVTYLFDGKIRHRDSLGTEMVIQPGDVNLMTAGRGIVHSERTPEELRGAPMSISGLQTWLAPGASVKIPADAEERAIYTLEGEVSISGDRFPAERLLVFRPGDEIVVSAEGGAHFMLFGGASLGSQRYIWWNFVSSSKERIEQAKEEWKTGRFDIVPGDEQEFIPLPES